jgi:mevalonate kinase
LLFNSYYNAKLLLTAEYLVLNGAKALAVPLKFGQRLCVEENEQGFISWQSIAHDGSIWFSGKYSLRDFSIIESSNPDIAKHPQRLLVASQKLNPAFCCSAKGYHVISTLNYPLLWGLGSSSTLISAVAGWAGIDPFNLHFEVSKGSGYDIACAITNGPLSYTLKDKKPLFEHVTFSPAFADKIYFVYRGNKQDSADEVQKYRNRNSDIDKNAIDAASILTERMIGASTLSDFEQVMREHEVLISKLLVVPPIKQTLFRNLPGEVKSLGAWGGDFCMLTWRDDAALLSAYLKSKNFEIWFNFNDIVL